MEWPELRLPLAALIADDTDTPRRIRALLKIVSEFRQRKDDKIAVLDLCDSLEICTYQLSGECETAAYEFAKSAANIRWV